MTAGRLGWFSLADVVTRIGAFAKAYRKGGGERRYVLFENTLVLEERLLADSALLMKTLNRHGRLIKVDLPITAQAIVAGWNLRILGLGGDARRAAQIRMRGGKGQLFREITARRAFEKVIADDPEVAMPAIHAYDQRDGVWLVEDIVEGRHADLNDLASFLSVSVPRLYRKTARLRVVRRDVVQCRALIAELVQSVSALAPLAQIPDDAHWLVGLCHGDLTLGNLIKSADGRFWLIDWEHAGVDPVAVDLAGAVIWQPPMREMALDLLRRLDGHASALPAERQLALGMIVVLQKRRIMHANLGVLDTTDDWRDRHIVQLIQSLV